MQQTHGHIIINGEKILVLARRSGWKRYFKLRKNGGDGVFFDAESDYIEDLVENHNSNYIIELKSGKSIHIE